MACHLSHKLPWSSLHEIALRRPVPGPQPVPLLELSQAETKRIAHFARCLVAAIQEFRDSDRSAEDERAVFDPKTWPDQVEHGYGGWMGFRESIVGGYVRLNIALMDPEALLPRYYPNGSTDWAIRVLLGYCEGGHPHHIMEHLLPAFEENHATLKLPLTAATSQVLRDHAARMFRCMHSVSGENGFLDADQVAEFIKLQMLF